MTLFRFFANVGNYGRPLTGHQRVMVRIRRLFIAAVNVFCHCNNYYIADRVHTVSAC